ncbi:MAG: alpha/beta hydrolase [Spirochaetes bacterium]|nr:MAG: alpha/beta hydrolase [Spirochaetota bacterium]
MYPRPRLARQIFMLCILLPALPCGAVRCAPPETGAMISFTVAVDSGTGVSVDVYTPEHAGALLGDVLVLPGWNHPRARWQHETRILALARERGFRLVFPEMGKTNYESRYFPETVLKWAPVPGGAWVRDALIPALQERGILKPGGKNFLLGYSTGGRGVLLVSLQNLGLFRAGASLSGDCDQTLLPSEPLYTEQYGAFAQNGARWKAVDNPLTSIAEWRMPLYLGHGKKDAVCPYAQTEIFYNALRAHYPLLRTVLHLDAGAAHDFAYWDSELPAVFDFFRDTE